LSEGWKIAEPPFRRVERTGPASARFGDRVVGVLPKLRRFARGLARSASEADDLVQAACERALSREHQFQEGTRFDSWMFRIVQTILDRSASGHARSARRMEDVAEDRLGTNEPVRAGRGAPRPGRSSPGDRAPAAGPAYDAMLVTVEGLATRRRPKSSACRSEPS